MDRITEQLSQLQELSNDELSQLEEAVLAEFSSIESQELTSKSVSTMTQLADAVEAVRSEAARRVTEAQALADQAAEAASRVNGPTEEAAVEAPAEAAISDIMDENKDESPVEAPADAPVADIVVAEPVETPADETAEPSVMQDEEKKKKDEEYVVPSTASVDETHEAEAAVEQPEGSEAAVEELSVEEPAEAEAQFSAEEPAAAETELSAEAPAEAEAAVEAEAVEELSVETPVEAEASIEEVTETTNTEATVTAAANGSEGSLEMQTPADHMPHVKPATTLSITAGADIPGISAGTKFNNTLDVADAFAKRLHTLRHVHGGDGEQHIVASFRQEFPETRQLSMNDPQGTTDKIQNVTSSEAIVAAAGVCLPLETKYDLGCDVGVTDRPVRDALARFGADRGGIRYFTAPTLTSPDFALASGFYRNVGGAWHTYGPDRTTATDPVDTKPCLEMQCAAEATALIEAVTLCLTFNNLTTRVFPELIKRQNELALVAHARVAENALLAQIEAGSTAITAQTQVVGATRELLGLFDRAVSAYRYKHRMNAVAPLRAIIPVWVKNLMRADLALQMPGDGLEVLDIAEGKIDAWFRSRGVNVAWHLDGNGPAAVDLDGAGSGTAVGFEFPSTIEFGLFAEGTWLFLDGGTLDLGIIRDSSLVATNQYKQFVETFEGVANVGCDSYWVTAAYEPSGQAASLVDTLA